MNHFELVLLIAAVAMLVALFLFRHAIKRDIVAYEERMRERNAAHLAELQKANRAISNAAVDVSNAAKAIRKGV